MHKGELAKRYQDSPSTRKECSTKLRCDVSAKQIFRTWMKTLLHCGFGKTQVNQITFEPMHSAQAQSVRVKEKIYFGIVGHHCRDITRSYNTCIFYPRFRVKSLRFEL